jgi:hypothetical protein
MSGEELGEQEKKPRLRYDRALLDEVLKRDGATLVGDVNKVSACRKITYICCCGKESIKTFKNMVSYGGAFCKECYKKGRKEKTEKTNQERYGVNNQLQRNEIKEKIMKTNKEKYGVEHTLQSKELRQKGYNNNLNKYGVMFPQQTKEVKDKAKQSCKEKYGVDNPSKSNEIKTKKRLSTFKTLGVEYPGQSNIVKEKIKETCKKKYGTEHPSQNPEVMERTQKNAKKYKEFKMPSGEIRKVQGYEPFALTTLLQTYTEEQIKTDRKDVPRIEYEDNGKKRYYFPDIFLPHENKIIEVKSTWTYKCKADNVNKKADACREKGYVFEFWVYNAKGERVKEN